MFESKVSDQEFNPTRLGILVNQCYLIRRTISEAIKENSSNLNGKILDYGCGSKPYKRFFESTSYIGVDIETSGHPTSRKHADVFFDGINLPFQNDEFDGVLASEVFEHVFELHECLTEIARVLKPGGYLLATCPFVWPLHEKPYDFARYTPWALQKLLEEAGFNIIKIERRGKSIEALGQIFIIELLPKILKILLFWKPIRRRLENPIMGFVTLTCRILARLQTAEPDFYLTNLVVAEKRASRHPSGNKHEDSHNF